MAGPCDSFTEYRRASAVNARLFFLVLGVRCLLFVLVSFPGLVDNVGVSRICLSDGHVGLGEGKLRRIRKTGHAFRPVAAAQDDAIPILMHFRRGVTQIGDRAVLYPSAAAVDEGRVASFAVKRHVKFFALVNDFLAYFSLRR